MRYKISTMPDAVRRLLPQDAKKELGVAGLCLDELIERQAIKSEKALQRQVADFLRLRGIPFYQNRMDKRTTGKIGTPDFLCCCKGFTAIECKFDGGMVTDEQADELRKIRDSGGNTLIAMNLASVKVFLDTLEHP